jgi:2-methylisocitrate lyase-like PEP mutase family enzyme
MTTATQEQKANLFRQLHDRSRIFVLPNAWDVVSALLVQEAGYPAVATTSAGVAWMLGYPDGQQIQREEMLDIVRRIAQAVSVPMTADMEAGYGNTPEDAARTARGVVEAGAVGLNLEDAAHDPKQPLVDVSLHIEKIKAVREVAAATGVPLVLNARTDVYLANVGDPVDRFAHAVRRANAYREAGADCLFVPAVRDAETIGKLVKEINGPVNILAGPGSPSAPELDKLGVARMSVGGALMRATLTHLKRLVADFHATGVHTPLTEGVISHVDLNKLLAQRAGH